VDQARAEAHAAEAATEEELSAALMLERVGLVKQARSSLCMCGNRDVRCTALAFHFVHCVCSRL
jgi:hypothetical protein